MAEYSVDDREYPEGELRDEIERLTAELQTLTKQRDHYQRLVSWTDSRKHKGGE